MKSSGRPENTVKARHSIATRLLKVVFALYIIIAAVVTVSHMVMEYRYQEKNISRDLQGIQRTFEQQLAGDIWKMREDSLRSTVKGMLDIPTVVGAAIRNDKGQDIAVGGIITCDGQVGEVGLHVRILGISPEQIKVEKDKKHDYELIGHSFPIIYRYSGGEKRLGEATIYSSTSVILQRVKLGFLLLIVTTVFKIAVFWFIFMWAFKSILQGPLSILTAATGKVDLDNLEAAKVDIKRGGDDEIKLLADSFNSMVTNLETSLAERKLADEKLKHFQKAVESSADAIGMSTPEGKHYYQNRAFNDLFGLPVEQVDGESGPPSTIYKDEKVGHEVFETIMRGDSWRGEVEMVGKDNRILNILLRAYSIKDREGKVIGLVGVHTDITDRKKAEAEIERIFNMTNYMVCVANLQGYFTRINSSFEQILGYTSKELLSKPFFEFIHPDDVENTKAIVEEKLSGGEMVIAFENRYRCKDGSYKWLSWTSQPVLKEDVTYSIAYDITDRKHAEDERDKLVKTLEYKNKELRDIVYTTSHDLRSPLVNIEGFSGELTSDCDRLIEILTARESEKIDHGQIETLLKENIPESLKFIRGSAEKMSRLLDGLLQISRVGTVEIDCQPVDMDRLVGEVLASMEFQIKENDINVTVEPLGNCYGDLNMLNKVFSNIIENAIKYRDPNKESVIKISCDKIEPMIVYCVEDNGVGIAADHQKKVFEIFHRLNPEGGVKGEGLGLTIVTRVLDRLGGAIHVESEPGKGSRFFVTLPAYN